MKGDQLAYSKNVCNHTFHYECISKWLKINGSCPYCRRVVIEKKKVDRERETLIWWLGRAFISEERDASEMGDVGLMLLYM